MWQLLREMADSLNLTYDLESMEHEGWGQKGPTGKWNGALGRLAEGVRLTGQKDQTVSGEPKSENCLKNFFISSHCSPCVINEKKGKLS